MSLEVGDKVKFRVGNIDGEGVITEIRPTFVVVKSGKGHLVFGMEWEKKLEKISDTND